MTIVVAAAEGVVALAQMALVMFCILLGVEENHVTGSEYVIALLIAYAFLSK